MPNRVAGYLFHGLQSAGFRIRQVIANSVNYSRIGSVQLPFDTHFSSEFRTPHQIRLMESCVIKARTILNGRSDTRTYGIDCGPETYIKENCYFDAYGGFIEVGGQAAFGQNTIIHGGGGVSIGRNVIVGAFSYIIASNHEFNSRELPIMLQGERRLGISIGSNVWIGGGVIILDGVTVGDNCVIGAGTIVTKSVRSNTVVHNSLHYATRGIFDDPSD
jgi:acetyltransferase-like isoleucine patch superfamily enzyme